MTKSELIELIHNYNEWDDDLDETACPTGFVTCPICEGGGYLHVRKSYAKKPRCSEPKHRPDCPRAKFNDYVKQLGVKKKQ